MTNPPTPLRLLVVDDDDVDREQVVRLLGRSGLGAHLTEAEDAAEALALCKRDHFDCVLLDYYMPGIGGLDLVEKIVNESTAVVMLTGLGGDTVAQEAMARGAKMVLRKEGLSPEGLRQTIVDAVAQLRLESSAA